MKNKIRQTRMGQGITQTQLAKDIGISRPYLSDVENGNSVPTIGIAIKIAEALGSTVEHIFLNEMSYVVDKEQIS